MRLRGAALATLALTLAVAAPAAAAPRAPTIDPVARPVTAQPLLVDITATIPLTGRAAPGEPVALSARCSLLLCVTTARANRKGRWRARLHVVVPWAEEVEEHRDWLRDDRVHATDEGYAARAQLYADAARTCGLEPR